MRRTSSVKRSLAAVAALVLTLAACSSGDDEETDTSDDSLAPSDSATISVIDSYAPIGFTNDEGEQVGLDPDLGALLGPAMGIDLEVTPDAFESSMLGLQSGRVEFVSGASITAERLETMDFVPYFKDSYTLAVLPESDEIGSEMTDLCGVTIGLVTGDVNIPMLEEFSNDECGDSALTISTYPDGAQIATAVQAGRVDAWACALTACSFQEAENPGTWKITGPAFGETTIGIASQKGSGWAEALAPALKDLVESGAYQEVLATYGLEDGAVTADEVVVNPEPNDA